jgi:hypothetical protein
MITPLYLALTVKTGPRGGARTQIKNLQRQQKTPVGISQQALGEYPTSLYKGIKRQTRASFRTGLSIKYESKW